MGWFSNHSIVQHNTCSTQLYNVHSIYMLFFTLWGNSWFNSKLLTLRTISSYLATLSLSLQYRALTSKTGLSGYIHLRTEGKEGGEGRRRGRRRGGRRGTRGEEEGGEGGG